MKDPLKIMLTLCLLAIAWCFYDGCQQDRFKQPQNSIEKKVQVKEAELKKLEQKVERHKAQQREIKKKYDQIFDSIINLPDSADTRLLFANLDRYEYLLDSSTGEDY